ncbi:hypothetical protein NQZ68_026382 [Dissostichus eleginoides]|nr:hypothetical protein NQZ68_026382 [Dissostichus eleginoides]
MYGDNALQKGGCNIINCLYICDATQALIDKAAHREFSAAFGNLPVFLGSCCSSFIVGAQNIPILWGERSPGCAAP